MRIIFCNATLSLWSKSDNQFGWRWSMLNAGLGEQHGYGATCDILYTPAGRGKYIFVKYCDRI